MLKKVFFKFIFTFFLKIFDKTDILEEKFDRDRIIKKVIPELINLTLKLPDLIKFPIPILKSGKKSN